MSSVSTYDSARTDEPAPTVLIIEDDPMHLALAEMTLQTAHYDCVSADNIEDGWNCLQTGIVSLVVSDLSLNGVELIERMRADPLTSNIPVIISSAERKQEARQAALDAGASEYLTKPFPLDDLVKHVRQCLGREEA